MSTVPSISLTAEEITDALERGEARGHFRMTQLCDSFPVLRNAPGTRPWDQLKFARWASNPGRTRARQHAAAFVLSVWNGGNPDDGGWWNGTLEGERFSVGVFDVVDAFSCWDSQQKQAFLAWCIDPFWP